MRYAFCLARRNIRLFLKNRLNILLSFASIFIILGIYFTFLRDFMMGIVIGYGVLPEQVNAFTDRFMTAGLLVVISTTTCFGMVQVFVSDAASGIKRDYLISPAAPFQLVIGYLLSSTLISSFFTCLTVLGLTQFFYFYYGSAPEFREIIQILGSVIYLSCLNSIILLCLSRFLKSVSTFSTLANLYGTLIGFLAGDYLPCYFYPGWLRKILFYFPPAQMTGVLRRLFTQNMNEKIYGIDPDFHKKLFLDLGIYMERNEKLVSMKDQWQILLISGLLLLVCLWLLNRERRRVKINKS